MTASPVRTIHRGRYAMRHQLGAGHFGEVWYGSDNLQGDDVAIKLLGPRVGLDAALLETRLLTRLRGHDRIVTIRNVELSPPLPFIVMDYLPEGSIGARVASAPASLVDAVRWTREALLGLAHAH